MFVAFCYKIIINEYCRTIGKTVPLHSEMNKKVMMKNLLYTTVVAMTAYMLAACTQDNVHAPEPEIVVVEKEVEVTPEEDFETDVHYVGTLTSGVPSMEALMEPVTTDCEMYLKDKTDKSSGYATLVLGAFDITVEAMGMNISMGEMTIEDVQYAVYPNGNGMFFKDDFQTMAGNYDTSGSLSGTFGADGSIEMTMVYKPGSMPFDCQSVFSGVISK